MSNNIQLSIITTSRGRAEYLEFHWDRFLAHAKYPDNIELSLYIDDDDIETIKKYEKMKEKNKNVRAVIGPRPKSITEGLNLAYENSTSNNLFFMVGDDCSVKTQEWDRIVMEEFDKFDDKILLVYGYDGVQGRRMATQIFIHKNWIDALGYLMPPHPMSDRWLSEVATGIDRRVYRRDLVLKHIYKRTRGDKTHTDRLGNRKADRRTYGSKLCCEKRQEDMDSLKKFIKNFKINNGDKNE